MLFVQESRWTRVWCPCPTATTSPGARAWTAWPSAQAEYYKAGARFAKWRSVVSIPQGPSYAALQDCAYGLARYAATAQVLVAFE